MLYNPFRTSALCRPACLPPFAPAALVYAQMDSFVTRQGNGFAFLIRNPSSFPPNPPHPPRPSPHPRPREPPRRRPGAAALSRSGAAAWRDLGVQHPELAKPCVLCTGRTTGRRACWAPSRPCWSGAQACYWSPSSWSRKQEPSVPPSRPQRSWRCTRSSPPRRRRRLHVGDHPLDKVRHALPASD